MKKIMVMALIGIVLMTGVSFAAAPMAEQETVKYNFGDFSSQTLATKSWEALNSQDYDAVAAYTQKCIDLYESKAIMQQKSLKDFAPKENAFDYWALNDVATCYFIQGKSYKAQGKIKEAKKSFSTVIGKFGYAQCWDSKGWFWKVADAAEDMLNTIEGDYDFGDYTSQTLTSKAWDALNSKDYKGVDVYTKKCFVLYEKDAVQQQKSLKDFAAKEKAFDYWALNDVATCYFIKGEALTAKKKYAQAKKAFEKVIREFSFAQCWDPQGWFWKVAVASRGKMNKIMAEM